MSYIIENIANPGYCGIDAGSIQFANGTATTEDAYLAEWYRTHEGYKVEEKKKSTK